MIGAHHWHSANQFFIFFVFESLPQVNTTWNRNAEILCTWEQLAGWLGNTQIMISAAAPPGPEQACGDATLKMNMIQYNLLIQSKADLLDWETWILRVTPAVPAATRGGAGTGAPWRSRGFRVPWPRTRTLAASGTQGGRLAIVTPIQAQVDLSRPELAAGDSEPEVAGSHGFPSPSPRRPGSGPWPPVHKTGPKTILRPFSTRICVAVWTAMSVPVTCLRWPRPGHDWQETVTLKPEFFNRRIGAVTVTVPLADYRHTTTPAMKSVSCPGPPVPFRNSHWQGRTATTCCTQNGRWRNARPSNTGLSLSNLPMYVATSTWWWYEYDVDLFCLCLLFNISSKWTSLTVLFSNAMMWKNLFFFLFWFNIDQAPLFLHWR